jgi:hypothetical protein
VYLTLSLPGHCDFETKRPAAKAPARQDGQALALRLRRAPGGVRAEYTFLKLMMELFCDCEDV